MADHKDVSVIATKEDMFVVVDGVRIARRGYLGTPQDGTWVSLVPGWEVVDNEDLRTIAVKHNGVIVHQGRWSFPSFLYPWLLMLRPFPPNPPHPHPISHHIIIKTPPAGVAEGVQGSGHHKYGSGLLTLQGSDA